jgi:GxxExxY protein
MEPQMNADERRLNEITERIIGCAFAVANELGVGFLEKVYRNALRLELLAAGLSVVQEHGISVRYRGEVVGEYWADLLVNECVLIELKAVREFDDVHKAQCINYLKATGLRICLLINFGKSKIDVKRIVRQF